MCVCVCTYIEIILIVYVYYFVKFKNLNYYQTCYTLLYTIMYLPLYLYIYIYLHTLLNLCSVVLSDINDRYVPSQQLGSSIYPYTSLYIIIKHNFRNIYVKIQDRQSQQPRLTNNRTLSMRLRELIPPCYTWSYDFILLTLCTAHYCGDSTMIATTAIASN